MAPTDAQSQNGAVPMTLFETDVIVWMLRGNKAAAEEIDAAIAHAQLDLYKLQSAIIQ